MFEEKEITKKKYLEAKRLLDKAWLRIFDIHPDTHPESTKLMRKEFPDSQFD